MSKDQKLNSKVNFTLKGLNSIQIGLYMLLFAYLIQGLLNGFMSDSSFLAMMSIQIVEVQIVFLAFLFILFSYFALFFSSRRTSRKNKKQFWNTPTKATFWVTFFLTVITIALLFFLNKQGLFLELTSVFLLLYGIYILLFNFRKKKQFQLLGAICLFLSIVTFIIPSYWYNSLLILGIGHVVYGLMVKE